MSEHATGVGAIILAAGASTRLGEPKQLLPFDGSTLLRRAARAALDSNCQTVVVVTGANAERVRGEVRDLPVVVAHNDDWNEGMSSSVRVGVGALAESARVLAALLMPCDQPHLSAEVLNRLMDAHHETGKPIIVSEYEKVWGVPMLFARALWPELRALHGDRGAQKIARRHAGEVECVPFPLGAFDVDTRDDSQKLADLQRSSKF